MGNTDFSDKIPPEVFRVVFKLEQAGFEAYLVGGCVRDVILNKKPKDFDIATDAKPDEIVKVFPESVATFAKFGTVLVLEHDERGETHEIEVTTYRSEMDYVDGRWPSKVEFATELSKDLGRRDFTINAMALALTPELRMKNEKIKNQNGVVDLFGGMLDLHKGVIRAVGTPLERFKEDGLRGFRACRFAATLGFEIEDETYHAIENSLDVASQISIERIRDEFVRLIMEAPKPSVGLELMRKIGLLKLFLPELLEGIDVVQPEYHTEDAYHHNLSCLNVAQDKVKLAALFHDIGKPRTKTSEFEPDYLEHLKQKGQVIPRYHFFGHDMEGEKMVQEIMNRMHFPKNEIEKTCKLVRWHMFYYQETWTDAAVRRFIQRVGEENIDDLFALRIADAECNPKSEFAPQDIQKLEERISKIRQEDMALKVTDLRIDGNDLMKLGVSQGPQVGKILNQLLEKVLDDPNVNTKKKLEKIAKDFMKK